MIDFRVMAEQIVASAVAALGEGAVLVAERAKHRAPVRNIFSGVNYGFRPKSISELDSDRAAGVIGSRITWKHEDMAPVKTAKGLRSSLERNWRQRRLLEAEFLLNAYKDEMAARKAGRRLGREPEPTRLTKRGAHEVKVALASSFRENPRSARWGQWGQSYVGGRLRGEIYATGATRSGSTAEAWVISPTEYARYQEFGTRHNRAHPYLRPALAESREEIVSRIAAAISESSRTGGPLAEITIEVRL